MTNPLFPKLILEQKMLSIRMGLIVSWFESRNTLTELKFFGSSLYSCVWVCVWVCGLREQKLMAGPNWRNRRRKRQAKTLFIWYAELKWKTSKRVEGDLESNPLINEGGGEKSAWGRDGCANSSWNTQWPRSEPVSVCLSTSQYLMTSLQWLVDKLCFASSTSPRFGQLSKRLAYSADVHDYMTTACMTSLFG